MIQFTWLCRFLQDPLCKLSHDEALVDVIIVLDALDEADHRNMGWEPVGQLLAKGSVTIEIFSRGSFCSGSSGVTTINLKIECSICSRLLKLPAFVRMIITSRPDEGKDTFKNCKPREIKPEFKTNQDDLEGLLNVRLKDYDNVPGEELKSEAVEIIQKKSKVWIQTRDCSQETT